MEFLFTSGEEQNLAQISERKKIQELKASCY